MAGSPYPGSVHKFPQLFHFNAAELHSWRDSVGYPAQMEQYPGGLKHYGYVCNIDWNMWLTVRGGAYSSPHYCLFLLLWTLMAVLCWCVCVCVWKKQLDVQNANRRLMWLILEIKLLLIGCRWDLQWLSHARIHDSNNRPPPWRGGSGGRRLKPLHWLWRS